MPLLAQRNASVERSDGANIYRGPLFPPLPFAAHDGCYRLPMRLPEYESAAVRLEDIWFRDDASDAHRRLMLKLGRDLEHINYGYRPLSGEDLPCICALIETLESHYNAAL